MKKKNNAQILNLSHLPSPLYGYQEWLLLYAAHWILFLISSERHPSGAWQRLTDPNRSISNRFETLRKSNKNRVLLVYFLD